MFSSRQTCDTLRPCLMSYMCTCDMIPQSRSLFSQKRDVKRTFGPVAHVVACSCACNTFRVHVKIFHQSTEAFRLAGLREHANTRTPNNGTEFVNWIAEEGAASSNQVSAKMKWTK